MTTKIQEVESTLNHDELNFFIKVYFKQLTSCDYINLHTQGNISLEKSARLKPHDWLPDQGWEDIMKLTTTNTEIFGSLADDIEKNGSAWKKVRKEHQDDL